MTGPLGSLEFLSYRPFLLVSRFCFPNFNHHVVLSRRICLFYKIRTHMRLDKTTLRLYVRNSSLGYHHVIWNEKTSVQAEKVSYDWLSWVFAHVFIGSFELLHLLTTGQGNCIVHELTTTLNYNPSAIRLLCLKATLPWIWGDAVALDKRYAFLSYFGSPLPVLIQMPLLRNLIYLYFRPAFLADLITEMETPSEMESFQTEA